jgi:hypothetical protein
MKDSQKAPLNLIFKKQTIALVIGKGKGVFEARHEVIVNWFC